MSIPSFKNFLKNKTLENKIYVAATLIEKTGFPIKAYVKWHENNGIFLTKKQFNKALNEGWADTLKDYGYEALKGAGSGALAGAAGGGGVGAIPGALVGAGINVAKKGYQDISNWWKSQSTNVQSWVKEFATTKQEAIKWDLHIIDLLKNALEI